MKKQPSRLGMFETQIAESTMMKYPLCREGVDCEIHAHVRAANPSFTITVHKRKGGSDARYFVLQSHN